jgi:ubiquinone/menaquinone biosynthesis C-methylase UbiE
VPRFDYDTIRDNYEADLAAAVGFSGRDLDFFVRAKARVLADVVERRLGPPAELAALDVGCGIGLVDEALDGRFGRLAGTDVTPGILEEAAERNPGVEYALSDGKRLPFDDGAFDVAFSATVIQVVPKAEQPGFAAELARVVRPGGLVVVYEHNPLNPATRLVVRRCTYGHDATMLGSRELSRVLAGAGLVVDERGHVLVTPWESRPALLLERLLRPLPLGAQYYVAARKV